MRQAPTKPATFPSVGLRPAFATVLFSTNRHKSVLWSAAVLTFFALWATAWYAYEHRSAPSTALSATNISNNPSGVAPTRHETVGTSPAPPPTGSSVQTNVQANTGGSSPTGNPSGSVSVTVNGQPIAVPQNGSTQKVLSDKNGQTTVNISSNSSSSADSGGSNTSTNLEVYTQTTSDSSSVP
ncbi:MAG TPA: hypothetical protein VHD60_01035 [Candidatus Saccharimonadales bacterium]|nr:hypothetical protein [Candidatus Saccharimonadales bacterium]